MENNNQNGQNRFDFHMGAIKHPELGTIFEGAEFHVELSDKAYSEQTASQLNALKFALPLIAEKIEAFVKAEIATREARRERHEKQLKEENSARLEDWNTQVAEYESRKLAFEKEHRAWEKRKAAAKEGEFIEFEPKFFENRPSRPHLCIF